MIYVIITIVSLITLFVIQEWLIYMAHIEREEREKEYKLHRDIVNKHQEEFEKKYPDYKE